MLYKLKKNMKINLSSLIIHLHAKITKLKLFIIHKNNYCKIKHNIVIRQMLCSTETRNLHNQQRDAIEIFSNINKTEWKRTFKLNATSNVFQRTTMNTKSFIFLAVL